MPGLGVFDYVRNRLILTIFRRQERHSCYLLGPSLFPFFLSGLSGAALQPKAHANDPQRPFFLPRLPPDTPVRLAQSASS